MCYFAIGYGSALKPCCLKEITLEEYEKQCENGLIGGAVGKSSSCPKDVIEAHDILKLNPGNCRKR